MKLWSEIRRHWGKLLVFLVLAAACGWLFTEGGKETREMLTEQVRNLPAFWFIVAYALLPVAGVPLSPLLVLAGVKFGFWQGMAVAAAGIFIHHVIAYHLVHGGLRRRVSERLERSSYSIPTPDAKNHVWFTAVFASVHGPPYAIKLYLLALTEVSFRVYLWVGAPVYIIFCVVPVGAGSSAISVNPLWLYGGLAAVMLLAFLGKWLGKSMSK
ncbi:TVP38/TMEM64 family protein [Luteolibacter yonseiensis]|uniref:TVP38/TMEM64 family membrane protein n=1 Tax=Luteolibacter yonseiensis TaxID=1144680 RepID=A0A934VCJ6_9BACT|nr:VTT domain-containing protein [Luteolibacter yonseiensis]MBK1817041.1 TVP38/TMEM64 family protein [Luteolibacter yonseiensis]